MNIWKIDADEEEPWWATLLGCLGLAILLALALLVD
jgi:hypothetical protein